MVGSDQKTSLAQNAASLAVLGIVFLCYVSCRDSEPPAGFLKQREWINENLSQVNNLISEFKALSIQKLVWSDTGFVTLIDGHGCVGEGRSVSELFAQNWYDSPTWRVEDVEKLMENATNLGANGIYFSDYLYIDFKNGFVLTVDEEGSLKGQRMVAPHKRVLQVRPGWYIFFDN